MNALSDVASPSLVKHTLRMAAKEAKEKLCDARGSMWAVICAIVLTLTSSDLMFADKELSLLGRSENLYIVTSVAVGLGLLVAGLFAADRGVIVEKRMALDETMRTPTKRGALLLTRVLSAMAMWLLIFVISAPYIVVVGFGTGVTWVALTYTLVLGTLCVGAFTTLIVGLVAQSRSGRGATLVFSATFATLTVPTFLGTTSRNSLLGDTYNVLSPFAQTRISLASAIVDKEGLLVQLPHIATVAAFALIVGTFVAFATCGGLRRRGEWREGRGDRKPWGLHDATSTERTGPRLVDQGPEKPVGL
jgi:ABC-type transport system involved in cytochrome c biogenesis permease component